MDNPPIISDMTAALTIANHIRNGTIDTTKSPDWMQRFVQAEADGEYYSKIINDLEEQIRVQENALAGIKTEFERIQKETAEEIFKEIEKNADTNGSHTEIEIAYYNGYGEFHYDKWYQELKQKYGVE